MQESPHIYKGRIKAMAKTRESIMAEQLDDNNNTLSGYVEQKTGNSNGDGKVNGNGNGGYSEQNIQILEGLEAVRVRPGMYIGSTDQRGLHHLVYEIVDNSVDEAVIGAANHIDVVIQADGVVRVSDNGRGIPVDMHAEEHKSALEVVMTVLHAGGKFDSNTYKTSSGLHGVGASVVNALSEWMRVEVRRN